MVTVGTLPVAARYDGHADWYDNWARSAGSLLAVSTHWLVGGVAGHADVVPVGVGVGPGPTPAAQTAPSVAGRRRAVPLATGWPGGVLDRARRLVSEAVGCSPRLFVYVGVHPCFVNPFAEYLPDGVRLHPGYRESGWQAPTPFTGDTVRHRVGVHHLPLDELLTCFLTPYARLDRVAERRGGAVPEILAVRLTRITG